jgi:hypothetical protein
VDGRSSSTSAGGDVTNHCPSWIVCHRVSLLCVIADRTIARLPPSCQPIRSQ